MADVNDTDGAKVVGSSHGSKHRLRSEFGILKYEPQTSRAKRALRNGLLRMRDEGPAHGGDGQLATAETRKKDELSEPARAVQLGLPKFIRGNPLGCGCSEAHLAGATKPVNSHIEADYMCDSGWHNFVVFEIVGFENLGDATIKVNANGDLEESHEVTTGELKEY